MWYTPSMTKAECKTCGGVGRVSVGTHTLIRGICLDCFTRAVMWAADNAVQAPADEARTSLPNIHCWIPVSGGKRVPSGMIVRDGGFGKEVAITSDYVSEWKEAHPYLDIESILKEIRAWNISNKKKRKTFSGLHKHINSWVSRESEKGRRSKYWVEPNSEPIYMGEDMLEDRIGPEDVEEVEKFLDNMRLWESNE
jgi:hypothetical protein